MHSLMCNRRTSDFSSPESALPPEPPPEITDSPTSLAAAAAAEEQPRVKFLCSFGGSILPRPLDGKLRYVGGETRIVSVPRETNYEELMARMRELFGATWAIKYQQPDEDLDDALVSVVNDDDVTNMMEEYDKLGNFGDGFTRLRIFLFSHPEHEMGVSAAANASEETGKRYVDALNSITDVDGSRIPVATEQFFDAGIHAQFNLHRLTIPHQHSHGQRYNDVEGPSSPAYYSPGHHNPHEPLEFPLSPSSGRCRPGGFGDLGDRVPEEYVNVRKNPSLQCQQYEYYSPFVENMVWLPSDGVVGDKAGFPLSLGHTHNFYQGSGVCEHCRVAFQRNQAGVPDVRFHDPQLKHGCVGNEFAAQFSCVECFRGRETYLLNQDMKLEHGGHVKEQSEHHSLHNGLLDHHQLNHHPENMRGHCNEQFVIDGNGMGVPFARGNFYDGHSIAPNCISHKDPFLLRPTSELGNNQVCHGQQTMGARAHVHIPRFEDDAFQHGNSPAYVAKNLYQVAPGSPSAHSMMKAQGPMCPAPSCDAHGLVLQANGAAHVGIMMTTQDGGPMISHIGVDNQIENHRVAHGVHVSRKLFPIDGLVPPEFHYDHAIKSNANIIMQDNQHSFLPESVQCQTSVVDYSAPVEDVHLTPPSSCPIDDKMVASPPSVNCRTPAVGTDLATVTEAAESTLGGEAYKTEHAESVKELNACKTPPKEKQDIDFDSDRQKPIEKEASVSKHCGPDAYGQHEHGEFSVESLSFLPALIASVKKVVLEGCEEVKARANADVNVSPDQDERESSIDNLNALAELEQELEAEPIVVSKIEPTTTEEEALAKGSQIIKNDDLEEIRKLGSGTYGVVHYGKWKGSDVAIKRIKASCFAGKPSERERLIADFWKEALILSSLHHPNVVSFYGIVRDGPDGTLATVTEFMVNGSLKQFLQKKDRTIDRRKRLIIAMDAAFGMEYLHGKNVVHFDLKCENLLVNMRDPHRPVCKIGDLGLSKVKQKTLVSGGVRGTLPWMAPELLSGKSNLVTEKIDVYSFGIVMWELLTGEEPYADMRCASIIGGIVNNTLRPQIPTWCDPEWKSLMESCWSSDPVERLPFSEISQKLRKMSAAINVK